MPGGRSASERREPSSASSHPHPELDSIPARTRLRQTCRASRTTHPRSIERLIIDAETLMTVSLVDSCPLIDSATRATSLSSR